MKMFAIRAILISAVALVPSMASSQVDQNYVPLTTGPTADPFNANIAFGETFTPTFNDISGAGTYLTNMTNRSVTANLRVAAWGNDADNNPTLADVFVQYTLAAGQSAWVDAFWTPAAITPGTINYLQFLSDDAGVVEAWDDWPGTYAGGEAFFTDDGTWSGNGVFFPVDDVAFEEFHSPQAVSATPEPASLALLATGLVGVFGVTRRRRHLAK